LPGYDDVSVDKKKLDEIHDIVDSEEEIDEDKGYSDLNLEDTGDRQEQPDNFSSVLTKFRVKPDIAKEQRKEFNGKRAFFGTHVAYSNTKRTDNLRHLMSLDLTDTYDQIPILRELATDIMIAETSEFQMCRSNQRVGGFEAELGLVQIQRQDATVRQFQNPIIPEVKKKKILGFIPIKTKSKPNYNQEQGQ
jgi:hypothetical protein